MTLRVRGLRVKLVRVTFQLRNAFHLKVFLTYRCFRSPRTSHTVRGQNMRNTRERDTVTNTSLKLAITDTTRLRGRCVGLRCGLGRCFCFAEHVASLFSKIIQTVCHSGKPSALQLLFQANISKGLTHLETSKLYVCFYLNLQVRPSIFFLLSRFSKTSFYPATIPAPPEGRSSTGWTFPEHLQTKAPQDPSQSEMLNHLS